MARYAFILPLMIATIPEEGGETLETAAPLEETAAPLEETIDAGVLIEIEAPSLQEATSEFEKRLKRSVGAVCTVATAGRLNRLMNFSVPQPMSLEDCEAKAAAKMAELERRMGALPQDRAALGESKLDELQEPPTRVERRTLPETEPAPPGEGKDDVDLPPLDLVDDRDPGRGPSGEQGIQKV